MDGNRQEDNLRKFDLRVWAATLGTSAAIAYLLCVVLQPLFPNWAMYTSGFWQAAFPGFSWTLGGVVLGLIEAAIYGVLLALVFVPAHNFFSSRLGKADQVDK